ANTPAVNLYLSRGYTKNGDVEVAPGIYITRFRRGS
ncbi:MAG: GNAT family N-acetyltransferase, partial [Kribbellaceae bacterium]|nr:GNAT family N-acetyltransferase [Kribbellaceae bacterium]